MDGGRRSTHRSLHAYNTLSPPTYPLCIPDWILAVVKSRQGMARGIQLNQKRQSSPLRCRQKQLPGRTLGEAPSALVESHHIAGREMGVSSISGIHLAAIYENTREPTTPTSCRNASFALHIVLRGEQLMEPRNNQ
jgi:hypothetical protein